MPDNKEVARDGMPVVPASAISVGRRVLAEWGAVQPDNFFSADVGFQRSLEFHWGTAEYRKRAGYLYHFGGLLATVIDEAVTEANLESNLPRLQRFDGRGKRIEEVQFHPSHHEAGRHIYGSGMLAAHAEPGKKEAQKER